MPEYQGLRWKTSGNVSPQGKPRVYFCCYEADFARLFKPISEEILESAPNAAIWYYDPSDGVPGGEEFLANLSQMQLFILPVTAGFIQQKCRARMVELPYAVEHHIPVLPLLQEPNLEQAFNRLCGNLQMLNKEAEQNDRTVVPYKERLKRFLNDVLVSNETAARVRAAFDACIFLSYRKKDRAGAQQIMRLIHENDFCRDVSIWYDEFLTPGEDFNDEIAAAMDRSVLFVLVVTPSLLEIPNYVAATEYPEAKRIGKPVLPIEASATDGAELSRVFRDIGPALQITQVAARLREALSGVTLRQKEGDPAHDYLIGLAYLSGIDVEKDYARALELITSAAEAELPEAMNKLASMYFRGEGVKQDYHTGFAWQKRYAAFLQQEADFSPTEENLTQLFNCRWDMGDEQGDSGLRELKDLTAARESYTAMLRTAEQMRSLGFSQGRRNVEISYQKLGDTCKAEGRIAEAKEWYLKALEIAEALARECGTADDRRDLSVSYNKLAFICRIEKDLTGMMGWLRKGRELREALVREEPSELARRDLAFTYLWIGKTTYLLKDPEGAKEWFRQCVKIREELLQETDTLQHRTDLSFVLEWLYTVCLETGDILEAEEVNWRLHVLRGQPAGKSPREETAEEKRTRLTKRLEFCNLLRKNGEPAIAKSRLQEDWISAQALALKSDEAEDRGIAVVFCCRLGELCKAEGKPDKASEWFLKGFERAKELIRDPGAEHWCQREQSVLRTLYEELRSVRDESELTDYCRKLDALCKKNVPSSRTEAPPAEKHKPAFKRLMEKLGLRT